MALSPELQRQAETIVADHALEISRRMPPSQINTEAAKIELGEAVKMEQIAREVRKGPSHSRRARYKNGSHTELQTVTTGSNAVSSTTQSVDAQGEAKRMLVTHGELSESFKETSLSRGSRSRTADRLASVHKELGVAPVDIEVFRHVIRGAEAPVTQVPDRPANPAKPVLVGEFTRDIASQALEGLRKIRGYLSEARRLKT